MAMPMACVADEQALATAKVGPCAAIAHAQRRRPGAGDQPRHGKGVRPAVFPDVKPIEPIVDRGDSADAVPRITAVRGPCGSSRDSPA